MNDDIFKAAHRMQHGGSFAEAISDAYFAADPQNRARLVFAFADLFDRYLDRPALTEEEQA